MARRLKLLTGLSTLALSGALALSACSGEGEGEGEGAKAAGSSRHAQHGSAEGEGDGKRGEGKGGEGKGGEGEGGEGEGGEGEGSSAADPAADDVAYLTQLALVRGHLKAFVELYRAGAYDHASTHVKHPESELYAKLIPAFEARGNGGFAEELRALVAANEAREGVDEAYAAAKAAIEADYPTVTTKSGLLAIAAVARMAADEFDIAVEDDGSIGNLHEYQDAYGFLSVAREILDGASPSSDAEREAVDAAKGQIEGVLGQFDGWTPTSAAMQPSAIYGAAARIEIAANGL